MLQLSYNIWSILDPSIAPIDHTQTPEYINYKTGVPRLHPVEDVFRGELVQVKYFKDFDEDTEEYSNLILCVEFEWERDSRNRLKRRIATRKWTTRTSTDENPVYGPHVRVDRKHYNKKKSRIADIRRRENIVEELTARASEFGAEIPNQKMRLALDHSFGPYIDTGNPQLVQDVQDYVDPDGVPWLEAETEIYVPEQDITIALTVRDAIKAQLSLGVVT